MATYYPVTSGYFHTLGIPFLKGRVFSEQDTVNTQKVCIISETLARQRFPNEDPIGKALFIEKVGSGEETRYVIVGVVGDTKYGSLSNENDPQLYVLLVQDPAYLMDFNNYHAVLVVRAESEPLRLANSVRERIWAVHRNQPVYDVTTLALALSENLSAPRSNAIFFILSAVLALMLATVGIYGVISYAVTHRTQEIGIRMALGAQPRDVFKLVLWQGAALTLIGIAVGLVGAFGLMGFLESLLFGVTVTDPVAFIGVSLLLFSVALLACYIPARRATKVDPMVALRYE